MDKLAQIKTVKGFLEVKHKEKGSLFLSKLFHIESEEEAFEILQKVKKEHYDATHHCYAFSIKKNITKYSDDGEPSGTAGIRILNAIQRNDLTDVMIIVVRYFGGTKLGVGPLGKAYYQSALKAAKSANTLILNLYSIFSIRYDYDLSGQMHHLINSHDGRILDSRYENMPVIDAAIPSDREVLFLSDFKVKSAGKAVLEKSGEEYY